MSAGAQVGAALAGLREGFQADGADLEVVSVENGVARVRLVVTDQTCLDCIVPGPVLRQVVEASVRQSCPEVHSVEIDDPR